MKKLEDICPFVGKCSESNYGSEKACQTDYENCPVYQKLIKEQEIVENHKRWNWWW